VSNRERLRLRRIKVRIIRYLRANQLARNEAMEVLLRQANGEKVSYSVAVG
jgi:hypothetical protein